MFRKPGSPGPSHASICFMVLQMKYSMTHMGVVIIFLVDKVYVKALYGKLDYIEYS